MICTLREYQCDQSDQFQVNRRGMVASRIGKLKWKRYFWVLGEPPSALVQSIHYLEPGRIVDLDKYILGEKMRS